MGEEEIQGGGGDREGGWGEERELTFGLQMRPRERRTLPGERRRR